MESNDSNNSEQSHEGEDRLSMLPDDILLSILSKVDLTTAARTSAVSARWRDLPWLLPELNIDAGDFLPVSPLDPVERNHMDEAMVSLTRATRSFLAKPRTISALHLKLYLNSDNFSRDVGLLVGEAIGGGWLKDLDLAILDETHPVECSDESMIQLAQNVHGFFTSQPNVLHCLSKLTLYNVCFAKLDMHHLLFDCCKQLKHLVLSYCDAGPCSIWTIDAPNSKLSVLILQECRFKRLDLVCLPKLEKLEWDTWEPYSAPLSFGFVPSLGELDLICGASRYHPRLKLSEILHGAACIHTLTLDFQGENIWMQPEIKQLRTSFRNVWEHACDVAGEDRERNFSERCTLWEVGFGSSMNSLLKELQFVGFKSLEQQFTFIKAVLERAPNLQKIVLSNDEACDTCDALDTPPPSLTESRFPTNEDEQEMAASRIKDGIFSLEIIFDESRVRNRHVCA